MSVIDANCEGACASEAAIAFKKLAMIRLREEMQREKPTMLNCSKDEVFSFIILIYLIMVFVTARN
jgi:hypothetical protein